MNIYIAGPMTGVAEFNYPAFHRAAERLRALGHAVTSPAEVAHADNGVRGSIRHADYLRRDLRELLQCDAMALLPSWQGSKGARLEVEIATALEFVFYDAGTGARLGDALPVFDDVRTSDAPPLSRPRLVVDVLNMGMVQDIADALTEALPSVPEGSKAHARIVDVMERARMQATSHEERRGAVLRAQREEAEATGLA